MAWDEALHPREAGKFAPKAGTKSSGESLSFDGKRGAGYGTKGGDNRVKELQTALNKLGLTDAAGKPLQLDGKLGPKTTAAIKKAQRKLGMTADGKVTPEFLAGIKKAAAGKATAKKAATPAKKTAPTRKVAPGLAAAKANAAKKAAPAKKATPAKKENPGLAAAKARAGRA